MFYRLRDNVVITKICGMNVLIPGGNNSYIRSFILDTPTHEICLWLKQEREVGKSLFDDTVNQKKILLSETEEKAYTDNIDRLIRMHIIEEIKE